MSSESGRILIANSQVIASLKEGDHLGCDVQGRLYIQKPPGEASPITEFFRRFQKEATKEDTSNAVVLATEKYFETLDPKEFPERYREILEILKREGFLLPGDRTRLVDIIYHHRHQGLIKSGYDSITAEGILSIEMSFDAEIALEVRKQICPQLINQGLGGSYYIKNFRGEKIGVFKPSDEEVYMPHNPRDKLPDVHDRFLRKGKRQRVGHIAGTSCYKETLAYDLAGKSSGIPFTTLITVPFPVAKGSRSMMLKTGSFQQFMPGVSFHELKISDITSIPTTEVQKQAAFDLAFGNSDRNYGNGLYDKRKGELHSIDQGLILLDSLNWNNPVHDIFAETHGCWMVFSQAKESIDAEIKNWIHDLNEGEIEQKIRATFVSMLTLENPPPKMEELQKYVDGIVVANKTQILFLKKAVEKGFTLYEIGEMVMETSSNSISRPLLERICKKMSVSLKDPEVQEDPWKFLSSLMDEHLERELKK
ncbi:MAG: hypothetical protein HKM07_01045 [Chlamydiae bacterium]|nr:hypothetical protein [Chlamydiota bacterium]